MAQHETAGSILVNMLSSERQADENNLTTTSAEQSNKESPLRSFLIMAGVRSTAN